MTDKQRPETERYHAKLPEHTARDIPHEVLRAMSRNPQCKNFIEGRCGPTPCAPCDENGGYPVEIDHIVPRARGGKSTIDNLQLLCPSANRSKFTRPDPNYSSACWWDSRLDTKKLRPHQRDRSFDLVSHQYREFFAQPQQLMNKILLFAWAVGSGKTVGTVAAIFAYNQVRNAETIGARRAKRVLWMVHQEALVKALKVELETELTGYGLTQIKPRVTHVNNAGKWEYEADIVVACPQSLWPSEGRTLSDDDRRAILSRFDVIVIDEAQFAVDRYMEILREAPQALKFAVTATPMDRNGTMLCDVEEGKYKDHFVLLSSFGYTDGRTLGFFKELKPFADGEGVTYHAVSGGKAEIRRGDLLERVDSTDHQHNLTRANAVISRAIEQARIEKKHSEYDCHIMVRVDNIERATAFAGYLEGGADEGMGSCVAHSKSKGPALGDPKHPWMLIKKTGKAQKESKRIVVVVDIGQFGINNRYCGVIAWVDPVMSKVEIVQRIGRAIRSHEGFGAVRLVWNDRNQEFRERLKDAIDYMLDMDAQMSGFATLESLSGSSVVIPEADPELRMPICDKIILSSIIGGDPGMSMDAVLDTWEGMKGGDLTDGQRSCGEAFVNKLIQSPEYRNKMFRMPGSLLFGAKIVEKEACPDSYPVSYLKERVKQGAIFSSGNLQAQYIELLDDGTHQNHQLAVDTVTALVREAEAKVFAIREMSVPPAIMVAGNAQQCKEYGTTSMSMEVAREFSPLLSGKLDHRQLASICIRRSYMAAARAFGLPDFKEKTYQGYRDQLAEALTHRDTRMAIIGITRALVMDEVARSHPEIQEAQNLRAIYSDQINEIVSVVTGDAGGASSWA